MVLDLAIRPRSHSSPDFHSIAEKGTGCTLAHAQVNTMTNGDRKKSTHAEFLNDFHIDCPSHNTRRMRPRRTFCNRRMPSARSNISVVIVHRAWSPVAARVVRLGHDIKWCVWDTPYALADSRIKDTPIASPSNRACVFRACRWAWRRLSAVRRGTRGCRTSRPVFARLVCEGR